MSYQQRTTKAVRTEKDRRAGLFKNRNKVDPQAWKNNKDSEEESSGEEEYEDAEDSQAGYRDDATEVGSKNLPSKEGQDPATTKGLDLKTTEGSEKPRRRKRKG